MAELLKKEIENQNESELKQFSVVINSESIQKGLLMKEIGSRQFCILVAILSHIDEYGQAFPSQRKLAEVTGMSLPTVNKGIKKLLETKINGEYIISRELLPSDIVGEYSLYTVNRTVMDVSEPAKIEVAKQEAKKPVTAEDIIAYVKDTERTKPLIPRDYLQFHSALCNKYLNATVIPNYKRETGMVKNKLMVAMSESELIEVIEFAVKNYDHYWYSDNYPVPTIGMLSSWLLNDAVKKMVASRKFEAQKKAESNIEYDNSFFLSL